MPTATIGVTQVDGQLQFDLQGASSTIEVVPPVEIVLTPTISDTTYAITFVPQSPVLELDGANIVPPLPSPPPDVGFESGQEPGTLVAQCVYPQASFTGELVVDFGLSVDLPNPSGQPSVLKVETKDPTFVFKPPS